MLAIYVFSDLPGGVRPDLKGPYMDKWVHTLVYFILGGLLFRWVLLWERPGADERWKRFAIIATVALLYAITDEVHQFFIPGRVFDLGDIVADAVGGALAGSLAFLPPHLQHFVAHLRPARSHSLDSAASSAS